MEEAAKQRGGAGRNQGRKPLDEGSPTVVASVKMSAAQRDKLKRLGGSVWVRGRIDEAPDPEPKSDTVAAAVQR